MQRNFDLLGEIDDYESLQLIRSWHGIGHIELRINRYKQHADKLNRGCIIFPHDYLNKGYVIRHKEIELDEQGKISENWIIRAMSLKDWIAQRITYPPSHTAYDNKNGNARSVMHHYVNNNIINPADVNRQMQDIVLSDNLNRGPNVSWQSRFKNLAEELEKISIQSGLGWNIDIDYVAEKYVFKVLEGRDLTTGQSNLPPVIFSPEFDSLGQLTYVESQLDYKNYAVVGGQGEGVDRRIVMSENDVSGFERYELFVDARDVEEETDDDPPQPIPVPQIEERLQNRGNQKLAEHEQEIYMEGQALTKSPFEYEKDYDLGDMVTLQNKDWNVTMDARITEVTEIYEPSGQKIELTFGNDRPTLIDKIKQEIGGINQELTK